MTLTKIIQKKTDLFHICSPLETFQIYDIEKVFKFMIIEELSNLISIYRRL